MDILIVNGSSFIGINFIQHLLDKYIDYNIVSIESPEIDRHNLEQFENSRFHCYVVDTRDFSKFFKFWFRVDVAVNFSDNAIRTTELLENLKKQKLKKFLQVSSKTTNDLALCSFPSVPVVTLKLTNSYGYFQHPSEIVSGLITNALEGSKLTVTDSTRDWLSVLDCCRGLETLLHYGKPGESYVLGGGNEIKDIDIALFVMEQLRVSKDMLELKENQDESLVMDFSKLNEQYNWVPIIDMSSGLVDTIEWYKENESWWKALKTHV